MRTVYRCSVVTEPLIVMTASHFPFSSLTVSPRTESCLVRDHVLPGDTHAGRDLAASAEAWCCGETPVFARLEIVGPETAHFTVLSFDEAGFGTLISETISPDSPLDRVCDGQLAGARHLVLLAPEGIDPEALGLNVELLELRATDHVRMVEREVFGLFREHSDLDPEVWIAARDGDRVACGHVAQAARADLFALVSLGGNDITIH